MSRKHKKSFPFFLWHRRLGLVAILFVVILSLTGIMLNHTEALSLDETLIESNWLLDWYNLNPSSEPIHFNNNGAYSITQWDNQVFLNTTPLMVSKQIIQGVVSINNMIVIAFQNEIALIDHQGELIERIDTTPNFAHIAKLGIYQDNVIIKTIDENYYATDKHIVTWSITSDKNSSWSVQDDISEQHRDLLLNSYRGSGLNLERIILDLHSGRFFHKRWGTYIMDISAIVLLWLCISGLWVWSSRRKKLRLKKHFHKHHRQ